MVSKHTENNYISKFLTPHYNCDPKLPQSFLMKTECDYSVVYTPRKLKLHLSIIHMIQTVKLHSEQYREIKLSMRKSITCPSRPLSPPKEYVEINHVFRD